MFIKTERERERENDKCVEGCVKNSEDNSLAKTGRV